MNLTRMLTDVGLTHFLALGAVLFSLGVFTILSRKNAVSILMGVELVLNAANLNFVAFSQHSPQAVSGMVFAIFVIILAAAEAAVALAIIVGIYQNFNTVDVDSAKVLRG